VAQWTSNTPKEQKTRVQIPPRHNFFMEIIEMLSCLSGCCAEKDKKALGKNYLRLPSFFETT
jgi:hypothetical protein